MAAWLDIHQIALNMQNRFAIFLIVGKIHNFLIIVVQFFTAEENKKSISKPKGLVKVSTRLLNMQ